MLLAIASLGTGVSAEQSEEPLEAIEFDNDTDTGCWIEHINTDDGSTWVEWRDPCPVKVGVVAEADIDSGNNTTMVRIAGGGSGVLADTGCWVIRMVNNQVVIDGETSDVLPGADDESIAGFQKPQCNLQILKGGFGGTGAPGHAGGIGIEGPKWVS